MGQIRFHQKNATHFVTNRCEHEMFLLLPHKTTNELILFWLAKAKTKFGDGIEIFGFVFLSNHFHILLRDTKGQLAKFMGYFQANLAKSVNSDIGRRGTFWAREYDDVIVDGEEEFWDRYAYVLCNPVKSGLVATPLQWGGVSSLSHTLENKPVQITGINKTLFNEARRFGRKADPKDFEETYEFKPTTPPAWKYWPHEKRKGALQGLVASACTKYRKDRLGKPALGMRKVMGQQPTDSPRNPASRPRFKFFCLDKERLKELKAAYRQFVGYYRECLGALFHNLNNPRRVAQIQWPEWGYPPTCHVPVGF